MKPCPEPEHSTTDLRSRNGRVSTRRHAKTERRKQLVSKPPFGLISQKPQRDATRKRESWSAVCMSETTARA